MKLIVIFGLIGAFELLFSCTNKVNSINEETKKETVVVSTNDTLNRIQSKLFIKKDYFKSSFNLYKDTMDLRDDMQFFDQFISVIGFEDEKVAYNVDSLVFNLNLLFFDSTDAKYTLNQCLRKTYNSISKINNYGDVFVYEYTNQRKAGCGEYNNYILLNKEKKEVLLVRASSFSIQYSKSIVFSIDVRGNKGQQNTICYDESKQHFMRTK